MLNVVDSFHAVTMNVSPCRVVDPIDVCVCMCGMYGKSIYDRVFHTVTVCPVCLLTRLLDFSMRANRGQKVNNHDLVEREKEQAGGLLTGCFFVTPHA